jgi:hypothetical protein
MATPPEKPRPRINPLLDKDEYQIAAKPVVERALPEYVTRHLRAAEQKRISAAEELPPSPRWPMLSGVLLFPFYLTSLEVLLFTTVGLMLSAWLLMFWIAYGAIGGATTAYYIGLPACAAGTLTLGYIATCCLTIIESTAEGWDSFQISPGIEWKEWIWNFAHITALVLQAGMVGYAVQLLCFTESWLPMIVVTYAVFPMVLLAALAAEGAWIPLAIGSVLRSLVQVGWAWGLFYFETTPMVIAWSIITVRELAGKTPWLTPLYTAPLLAIIILIYARLLGRLAGCISASTKQAQTEREDDEQ